MMLLDAENMVFVGLDNLPDKPVLISHDYKLDDDGNVLSYTAELWEVEKMQRYLQQLG